MYLDKRMLVRAAMDAMSNAYAPYSHFHVGAALLGNDGEIYTGCNVENSSYGASMCAERAAVSRAVSQGCRRFTAIAIAGGSRGMMGGRVPPCGICRQVLSEFCTPSQFRVLLAVSMDEWQEYTLEDLLPMGFSLNDPAMG